jgi:hypothetical protein
VKARERVLAGLLRMRGPLVAAAADVRFLVRNAVVLDPASAASAWSQLAPGRVDRLGELDRERCQARGANALDETMSLPHAALP